MSHTPHIMIAEARFYGDLADLLLSGAKGALDTAGATYDVFTVPGALELPCAVKMAAEKGIYDGFVALGCVIRGETTHYETVCNESARGLMDLSVHYDLIIGNGIQTCENKEQALARCHPAQKNKGAGAAKAALDLLAIHEELNKK